MNVGLQSLAVCLQILTLAHQLNNNILRRGASAGLWDDLRFLLDMLPHVKTEEDPRLGMASTHRGPSILAGDAAVNALEVCPLATLHDASAVLAAVCTEAVRSLHADCIFC